MFQGWIKNAQRHSGGPYRVRRWRSLIGVPLSLLLVFIHFIQPTLSRAFGGGKSRQASTLDTSQNSQNPLNQTEVDAAMVAVNLKPGETAYTVQGETSLGEISVRLYGTTRFWRKIAQWNGIESPYPIEANQVLVLRKKPDVSSERGDQILLEMWRKRLNKVERRLDLNQGAREAEEQRLAAEAERLEAERRKVEEEKRLEASAMIERLRQEALEAGEVEETKAPDSPEALFVAGQELFNAKQYEEALKKINQSREGNRSILPPWFYQIRILRLLKRDDEAEVMAKKLIENKPELQSLPMFRFLSKSSSGSQGESRE